MKKNCWEFMGCGRQPGGARVKELGICPAVIETRLHCVHGGTNAGRACWVVAGTLCKGETQGTFAQKFQNCELCDFYKAVKQEEVSNFIFSFTLLSMLKK
jgi:hypothetical protein